MAADPRKNYGEGTIFSVPLRNGGYARGVVARCDKRGLVFGYFFGPRLDSFPELTNEHDMPPGEAVLIGQFGDIGLRNGEWQQLGRIANWRREEWPLPLFVTPADDDCSVTLTQYDDDTLNAKSVKTTSRRDLDVDNLPVDRVMGYGFVEI